MLPFTIDYEKALDFEHCDDINSAIDRLSILTNYMNKIINVRHYCVKNLLDECSKYPAEKMHKLSWDNKMVCLLSVSKRDPAVVDLIELYFKADEAYKKLQLKHSQVTEEIMALKKIADITPR